MRLLAVSVLALAALAPLPAGVAAAEFDAALLKTGTGRCHMDSCTFFSLQTAQQIATVKDGTLFAMSELVWSAGYKAHGDDDRHEYDRPPIDVGTKTPDSFVVFCSKTRPYYFLTDEHGAWTAVALRPGDAAAVAGATEAVYSAYWASCHHFITRDPVAATMAKRLGYRFADGAASDPDDLVKQPLDLLR